MKVDIDVLSPIQRKIRVEIPGETVTEEFTRAYGTLGQRTRIKGFRAGKVPRRVLQGIYGDEVKSRALANLVQQALRKVVQDQGLQVVSHPDVEPGKLAEGDPFTFSAVVEVKPEIELKNYAGLEVERIKLEVQENQVDEALRGFQDAHAQLLPVEDRQVVEHGDFVLIDFVGTVEGKPFPGNKGENYLLQVDGGRSLPQFEEALVGLKTGVEQAVTLTFPKEHGARELAGKEALFRVRVREIKKKVLPALDDEFAKDYGECGSLDELKEKVRGRLASELKEMQTRELKEQLLTQMIEAHSFEVPAAMLDQQLRYLMERHQREVGSPGGPEGGAAPSLEGLRKDLEPQARRQVQGTLLVEAIAAKEKIAVSDAEVQQRVDELVRSARDQSVALRDYYKREEAQQDLCSQMVFKRTLDFLLERAKVKDVELPKSGKASVKSKVDEPKKKR
ncbi:MAG TPA: trigger factor [Candidatus Binatia bacterium]